MARIVSKAPPFIGRDSTPFKVSVPSIFLRGNDLCRGSPSRLAPAEVSAEWEETQRNGMNEPTELFIITRVRSFRRLNKARWKSGALVSYFGMILPRVFHRSVDSWDDDTGKMNSFGSYMKLCGSGFRSGQRE